MWQLTDHINHPRPLPLGVPLFGNLVEVALVEAHVLDAIDGKGELIFAGALTVVGATVVHNGCEGEGARKAVGERNGETLPDRPRGRPGRNTRRGRRGVKTPLTVEVGPTRELAVPVGNGGEWRHDEEGSARSKLVSDRGYVGGRLDCLPARREGERGGNEAGTQRGRRTSTDERAHPSPISSARMELRLLRWLDMSQLTPSAW